MKKSNFLNGAIIATAGIIICKIIGLVYVIPFYAMIGVTGGALYSYAYSIYAIFLNLSTSGIPVAMSKLVSEYNALEQYNTKERAFKIGSSIIIGLGLISFIALMIFAPTIANILKGGVEGGNSVESIASVIRVVSTALLVVPLFSVTKGYLQGHKMMTPSSIANVLEQLVRVIVLLLGSFIVVKVMNSSIELAVKISVFAATVGAAFGYLFLKIVINKNKKELNKNALAKEEELKITNKDIFKKIIFYAIPFVLVDLIDSFYVIVDSTTIIRTLTDMGMSGSNAEIVLSSIATWATKLDMIIISVSIGFVTSLIPHISSSYVKKEYNEDNRKINQALEMLTLIVLPLTLGLSFLATPVWTIFYGYNKLSVSVFRLYALQALTYSIHWLLVNILQSLNKSKITLGTLFGAFVFKAIFNIPAMKYLPLIGIPAYQGATVLTLFIQVVTIIFMLGYLKYKFNFHFRSSFGNMFKIFISALLMILGLLLLNSFIPAHVTTRFSSIMIVLLYALVGGIIYFISTYKFGLLNNFFKLLKSRRG